MTFAWMACAGGQEGPEEPDGQVAANPGNNAGAWVAPPPTVYPTTATTMYNPPPVTAPPPPSEQECRARASRTVPYDVSGASDVQTQFTRFFEPHHDTFRCCVDALEAPSRPYVNLKVAMTFEVAADGKLTAVKFAQGSDNLYPATSKCLTDIAGMLSYPAPIGGQAVSYTRKFDFKARR